MSHIYICTADDMHPYACDMDSRCIHCDRKKTKWHDPKTCALCDDGLPLTRKARTKARNKRMNRK